MTEVWILKVLVHEDWPIGDVWMEAGIFATAKEAKMRLKKLQFKYGPTRLTKWDLRRADIDTEELAA